MADETFTIEVYSNQAVDVRKALHARVRLNVTEKRRWFVWTRFTVTGPAQAVRDARAELDAWLEEDDRQRQW